MRHKYLKNVATLSLIEGKCKSCGICMDVCPHGVFLMKDDQLYIADKDSCMECGACAQNCPFSAIEVKSGVGCAYAIIMGRLTGTEPNCCGDSGGCC